MEVNMDFISQNGIKGQVAGQINAHGLNSDNMRPFLHTNKNGEIGAYVMSFKGGKRSNPANYSMVQIQTNATLRRDEWKHLDQAVIGVAESRLNGIADLISQGLVFDLGNGMQSTVLEYHDVSDAMSATMTMDGISRGKNDRPNYTTNYLPLPIIHADYEVNSRVLAASRNMGNPLDTTAAERASRKVNERLESMLFTNETYKYGGGTIYSYLNHPNRNLATLSSAWTASAKTGTQIVNEVISLKQKAINKHFYGPYMLYIPTGYETIMDEDYNPTSASPMTIRQRIESIANIKGVKVVDTLPADNVLLVQMTSDVVRLVRGMGVTNVEWKSEGNMVTNYKVMTIQVPQIRSDQSGNMGLVHLA